MRPIIWIGPLPPPVHGASLVTQRFLARVRRTGADVRVVSVAGTGTGWRHHRSRALRHVRALAVLCGLSRAGVVYLSLSGGRGLWYQVPLVAFARARRLRIVVHHHSYAYVSAHSAPMAAIARMLRPGDRQIFLSDSMRSEFLRRYCTSAIGSVVSNAWFVSPADGVRSAESIPVPRLVHVSNLSVAKGTDIAVRAAEQLRTTVTLIGPCSDPRILATIASGGAAVHWIGPQATERVYTELEAADVFLFPSSYVNEAEPLVVLEALSRGVPVIASRRGALGQLLPDEWLVDDLDPTTLARRVRALTSEPGWRPAASERARALFADLRRGPDPIDLVVGHTGPSVLQVLPTFDPAFGGPVSAALGVSDSYDDVGASLTTIGGGRPGESWRRFATLGFRTWSSPVGPQHVLTVSPGLLWFVLRRGRRFDLLHLHFNRSVGLVWVPLLARLTGTPYVLQTHGMCTPWTGARAWVDRLFTRPAMSHARAVCVLGAAERIDVLRTAPRARVVVVHNVVLAPQVVRGTSPERPRLLFCARLHPRKGLETFLDVVERLRDGVEAHVVGTDEGALASARARVRAGRLPVTFHGGLDRADVEAWMARCDVLLHPAAAEPFGMSMLEAFAVDLPVIASASSSLAPVFAAEGAALLPPDDDLDEWVAAVRRVLDEPDLVEALQAGGRTVLQRHFSRASLARVLGQVVEMGVAS